jgi:hypothetical protein
MATLHVGIHYPDVDQGLVTIVVDPFVRQAPDHKANRNGGLAGMIVVAGKSLLKIILLNPISQLLIGVNKVSKQGAKDNTLAFIGRRTCHVLQGFGMERLVYLQNKTLKNPH